MTIHQILFILAFLFLFLIVTPLWLTLRQVRKGKRSRRGQVPVQVPPRKLMNRWE